MLELSTLNCNSSARAERSFTIRYPDIVMKSLRGNIDIAQTYTAQF